eukprot:6002549-Ditylum_brightwellii.AAC.1
MKPVYELVGCILTHEFGKSRCAIHFHSYGISNPGDDMVSDRYGEILADVTNYTVHAVNVLDKFIASVYDENPWRPVSYRCCFQIFHEGEGIILQQS